MFSAARRRWLGVMLGLAMWAGLAPAAETTTPALVTAYHVAPAQRAALRQALQDTVRPRLRELKATGDLASYRVLFNRHADSELWDALLLVSFSNPAQMSRWNAAAADARVWPLLTALHTVPVESLRQRWAASAPRPGGVVLVIPYLSLVSAGDYLSYFDGYVLPQFEGWMREGALAATQLLGATLPAGRPWSHLVLLDYVSDDTLAARAAVVAKVRARLKEQPQWRAISENKAKVREERQAVVADDLTAGEGAP